MKGQDDVAFTKHATKSRARAVKEEYRMEELRDDGEKRTHRARGRAEEIEDAV